VCSPASGVVHTDITVSCKYGSYAPPTLCVLSLAFQVVTDILESFNREVMSTLDMLNVLKIAIALAVPAASSGNNFGVAVQVIDCSSMLS